MTSLILSIGSSGLVEWPDAAVGEPARRVRVRLENAVENGRSVAFGSRKWELDAACAEAAVPNWDGYGAEPVTAETYLMAERFLRAIPNSYPDPDIAVDADGELSLRWFRVQREVLAVSIRGDGRISFAAILGPNEFHGSEQFRDNQIPATIAAEMARFFATWP